MNREILIKRLVNRTLNAKHNAGWVVAPVVCFFSIAPKTSNPPALRRSEAADSLPTS